MEFDFSDDFFDENEEKKKKGCSPDLTYSPKQCTNKWFVDYEITPNSTIDEYHLVKFDADLLYYGKEYEKALDKYITRKSLLTYKNKALLREVLGSIIRCCLKLGRHEEALLYTDEMLNAAHNPGDSSTYELAFDVYSLCEDFKNATRVLIEALITNPWNAWYWANLHQTLSRLPLNSPVKVSGQSVVVNRNLLQATLAYSRFSLHGTYDEKVVPLRTKQILKMISTDEVPSKEETQTWRQRYTTLTEQCSMGDKVKTDTFFRQWFD